MFEEIYYLTYTSKITFFGAINLFIFKDIEKISIQNNHAQHISGFLLFKNGRYFQYLEGNKELISSLYQTISKDKRHKDVKIITEGMRPERLFKQWGMHCINLK